MNSDTKLPSLHRSRGDSGAPRRDGTRSDARHLRPECHIVVEPASYLPLGLSVPRG